MAKLNQQDVNQCSLSLFLENCSDCKLDNGTSGREYEEIIRLGKKNPRPVGGGLKSNSLGGLGGDRCNYNRLTAIYQVTFSHISYSAFT